MQPNHYDVLGQAREPRAASQMMRDGQSREHSGQSRPSGAAPMRSEDSWIEVSSQPSSSSLSSAATNDDIITTGLRVEQNQAGMYRHRSRRRRLQHLAAVTTAQVDFSSREASLAGSSQEEYEESESEPDPVMSSSNEEINRRALHAPQPEPPSNPSDADAASSDDDDASTALGMGISPSPFVPQPNVFSHPPSTNDHSWTRPNESRRSQPSVVSNSSRHTAIRRDSYPPSARSRRSQQSQHSPYNMISPSHHADHDAALRASLSTLLSCAAAARGIPKPDSQPPAPRPGPAQPSSFRLVGEDVAMGDDSTADGPSERYAETSPSVGAPRRRQPRAVVSPGPSAAKTKRRSTSPKDRTTSKKSRRLSVSDSTTTVSPIMTWVISAGVVVLFSAISFSAGYMIGREVGRTEVGMMGEGVPGARPSAACGQEAVRGGLRRFRWGAAASTASLA